MYVSTLLTPFYTFFWIVIKKYFSSQQSPNRQISPLLLLLLLLLLLCVCVYFVQFQAKGLKEHFTPFHYILIKKYNTLYTKRIFSYKIKRDTPSLRTHTHDRFTCTKWSFFFRTHHTHTNSHICVIPIYFHIYTIDIWYILLIRVCRDE